MVEYGERKAVNAELRYRLLFKQVKSEEGGCQDKNLRKEFSEAMCMVYRAKSYIPQKSRGKPAVILQTCR